MVLRLPQGSHGVRFVSDSLQVRLYGDLDAKRVADVLAAFVALGREVAREMFGDPDAVRWVLTDYHVECDGCGKRRSEKARAWKHEAGQDYCPKCAKGRA